MANASGDILQDILAALRGAGQFASVTLGDWGSETLVPRAAVEFEGTELLAAGEGDAGRIVRVRTKVTIRTRSEDVSDAAGRIAELCDLAISAIAADPYRGGLCDDTSAGSATVVEAAQVNSRLKRPEVEASFAVLCHYVESPAVASPPARLDGQDLFSSGPHKVSAGVWERQLQKRSFAHLAGQLVTDLGVRGRAIVQTGRLVAPTAEALRAAISAIEAFQDGRSHTLEDGAGEAYSPVVIEIFELTSPPTAGKGYWCGYSIRYLQLP